MEKLGFASKKHLFLLCLFVVCAAGFFFMVNLYNPPTGEDFSLAYLLGTDYHEKSPAKKVLAVINAVKTQSLGWNARLGEQLVIAVMGVDRFFYTVLNTLMGLLFFVILFKYAWGSVKEIKTPAGLFAGVVTYSAVVLFLPVLGEIFFMRNTAINYLWAIVLILLFVMPFFNHAMGHTVGAPPVLFSPVMFFLGLLAGMTNENTGIAVFCGIGSYIVYMAVKKDKVPAWFFFGAAGLALGIAYLLLSPSTAIRVKYYASVHTATGPAFPAMQRRGFDVARDFIISGIPLLVIFFTFVFLYAAREKMKINGFLTMINKDGRMKGVFVMLFFSLISVAVLMLPPYHETRSFLAAFTVLLIVICRLCYAVYSSLTKKQSGVLVAAAVILFLVSFYYSARVITKYAFFDRECAEREAEIRKQASAGKRVITVSPYKTKIRRYINTRDGYLAWAVQYPAYYKVDKILIEAQ